VVITGVFAVLKPFATPSPNIASPDMNPRIGLGITMIAKYPVIISRLLLVV
jgi:hypothetical protein